MSRQALSVPGITATIRAAPGSLISTKPVPLDTPMIAYSRPDGDVYPQQSAPVRKEPENSASGSQLSSCTPLAAKSLHDAPTGAWFLEERDYEIPSTLQEFLGQGSLPIIITFGSMGGSRNAEQEPVGPDGLQFLQLLEAFLGGAPKGKAVQQIFGQTQLFHQ